MTDEEKKISQEHKKFIEFLQKEVVKIEKEMLKRDEKNKQNERKQKYLPQIAAIVQKRSSSEGRSMKNSSSFSQFRQGKIRLPKV